MTDAQLDAAESIVITLANGAAVIFPAVGPFVVILEKLIDTAESHGIVPVELSVEQRASIAAGIAAAKASAVTSYRARAKP
jgi:hypothetical protein